MQIHEWFAAWVLCLIWQNVPPLSFWRPLLAHSGPFLVSPPVRQNPGACGASTWWIGQSTTGALGVFACCKECAILGCITAAQKGHHASSQPGNVTGRHLPWRHSSHYPPGHCGRKSRSNCTAQPYHSGVEFTAGLDPVCQPLSTVSLAASVDGIPWHSCRYRIREARSAEKVGC